MPKSRKKRLKELGSDVLADALLELEKRNEDAQTLIERLLETSDGAIKKFKKKLAKIERSDRYYDWRGVHGFAHELEDMLLDIRHNVKDAGVGLDLVARFFGIASAVFESGDDSDGSLGDIYRYSATDAFTYFAGLSADKKLVTDTLCDLLSGNDYGQSDNLLDDASEYLNKEEMRLLVTRLKKRADAETDDNLKRRFLRPLQTLAQNLNDPVLFEEARLALFGGEPIVAACIPIAASYLEAGDVEKAREWIEKVTLNESYMRHERDELLVRIYRQTGNKEGLEAAAWRIFRRHRTKDSLDDLLEDIDETKESVLSKELELIFEDPDFSTSDTNFLIACGEKEAAEKYVLSRETRIDGDFYDSVAALAKLLEQNELVHGAIVTYRALLDSILKRGRTKAYYYGARYLKKLDKMALNIEDWRGIENHDFYFEGLKRDHARKYSFWSKYEA